MEKWQAEISLKFKRVPWRIKVGFSYEWKAWLIAYDLLGMGPEEFGKIDVDKQLSALAFGAASWYRLKQGKSVFFTSEDIETALLNASKADNIEVINAMKYAQFPPWLKQGTDIVDKKKEKI